MKKEELKLNESMIYKADATKEIFPFSKLKDIFNMKEDVNKVELKISDGNTYARIYFTNSLTSLIKIDMSK